MTTRYVDVAFNGGRSAMARALFQYDYGQILRITDLELPVAYEVHFALNKSGNSVTQIGNADGVNIPDAMLLQNGSFYAWFYLHQTSDDGETRYEILFPVMQRAKPTNATPTPVQQDAITEAIAALNAAVEQTGADVEAAAASASSAADSESNAEAWAVGERDGTPVDPSDPTYHNNSAYYASVAESASQGGEGFALKAEGFAVGEQDGVPVESGSPYYHNNAEYYKNQSSGYSSNASAKATAAAGSALESEGWARGTQDGSEVSSGSPYYHNNAAYYAIDAGASAYNASVSETNAGNSATDAGNAKTAAETAQGLAEAAKIAADADALKAEGYAVGTQDGTPVSSGTYYHNNASYYAGEASNSATSASGYATDANNAKLAAQNAQTAAETAQGLAEAAQTGAEAAQTAAETARDAAISATEDKAPVILDSASGAIVSIVDGANGMNARSLVASMSPMQDLHGYDSPWPAGGRTNKLNLAKNVTVLSGNVPSAVTITSSDGTATITENYYDRNANKFGWAFDVEENETYVVSYTAQSSAAFMIKVYTSDGTLLVNSGTNATGDSYKIINTGSNTTLYFYATISTWGQTIELTNCQVTKGSTPIAYTPYSNICPITGRTGVTAYRTGVNVWDEEWEIGGFNYTTGAPLDSATDRIRSKNFCGCVPSTQYYWKIPYKNLRILYYDVNQNFIGYGDGWKDAPYVITTPNNAVFFKIAGSAAYGTTYNNDIAVNYPATDTDYHAYTGASFPVSWQSEAGTVYGGTVDLVSGLLTATHEMVDLGTLRWYYIASRNIFEADLVDAKPFANTEVATALCSQYVTKTYGNVYNNVFDGSISIAINSRVYVYDSAYTDVASFTQAMNGVQFCYELATPQTYQLDPQTVQMLLGANNVWATGDSVSLTYPCDTKLYIEKLTRPTEDDMVANANIPIHTFFMVGNGLYYSTAAIASGESIVVGTNCSRVSLADALNQINA